jgi:hypothetical protein
MATGHISTKQGSMKRTGGGVAVICFFCDFSSLYGQNVYVVGNCAELGNWNPENGKRMRFWWPWFIEVAITIPENLDVLNLEYKYVVLHDHVCLKKLIFNFA